MVVGLARAVGRAGAPLGVVGDLKVEGVRYRSQSHQAISGLEVGDPLWTAAKRAQRRCCSTRASPPRPRPAASAQRQVVVRERVPALLVDHGTPWELDSTGVLLEPLERGVVADVPLLVGPDFEGVSAGTHVTSSRVARGLRWAVTLADQTLQLAGQVSELDVSRDEVTTLAAPAAPRRGRGMAPLGAHAVRAASRARRRSTRRRPTESTSVRDK
jgi:hypothetical protein